MNVLIAEDNLVLQMTMEVIMDNWGYTYDIVSNGLEVVKKAQQNEGQYDICLMDIDMPFMNGFEATEQIRKNTKYFPIIALTGHDDIHKKYANFGMDDFLIKPYESSTLYNKINELTVKYEIIVFKDNHLYIHKEMPVDQQHVQELQELKKQNLIKVKFDDVSGSVVVVHENIMNKIVEDFNIKKQFVSTFLNRNPDKPTKCILFSNNCRMPQVYLDEETYSKELLKEEQIVENCNEMVLKITEK